MKWSRREPKKEERAQGVMAWEETQERSQSGSAVGADWRTAEGPPAIVLPIVLIPWGQVHWMCGTAKEVGHRTWSAT